MTSLGFTFAVVVAALVLAAGLWLEQGVLTVVGMLLLAGAVVGGLVLPSKESYAPRSVPSASDRAGDRVATAGILAVTAAAVLFGAGVWLEQGWLAVAGMLALAVATVVGLVRAGSHSWERSA